MDRIGAGSMGAVYRARQHTTARDVAIKILKRERAVDANAKARFLREARANSLLTSPHTVTVFDFGQAKTGELFLAMELLSGESLGQRLARTKALPPKEALSVATQVLASLAEAHAKGLIHRDLKPDNIFIAQIPGNSGEIVKVLDFGIAKFISDDAPVNAIETQAGTVFGTPRYMSPEQAQGKTLDGRSDLYSLGVILYQMLSGHPPFTDDDAVVVMARHIKTSPRPLNAVAPSVHASLDALVQRAIRKEPETRFENAEAMRVALAELLERNQLESIAPPPPKHPSIPPQPIGNFDGPAVPTALAGPSVPPSPLSSVEISSPGHKWPWWVAGVFVLASIAIVARNLAMRREVTAIAAQASTSQVSQSTETPALADPSVAPTSSSDDAGVVTTEPNVIPSPLSTASVKIEAASKVERRPTSQKGQNGSKYGSIEDP
ncbi:MAG: serine/threonine protein kinase [Polyangiaceae bacterium]|nr:serine/threonine protein kinase [Polyangiaceae bacterium]